MSSSPQESKSAARRAAQAAVIAESIEDARSAGLKYVTANDPGFHRRKHGRGFVYVDDRGKAIRDKAALERVRQLVIPPAWTDVWICTCERGHLQASGLDAKGRRQYIYHSCYREVRDLKKFRRALEFGSLLPRVRKAIESDLAVPGMPKQKVLALMVRLLDKTAVRVGNNEYARKNGSYGLTTLQNKHVRIDGSQIRFHFRAKSGVIQEFSLTDRRLARLLERTRSLRGSDLFQYCDEEGGLHPIQSSDVNDYLREISGQNITAKDFRTWHGTVQMLMELCQIGPATSATDAKRRVATAVKATASRLGNRPATCRGYYVHPEVIESYLSRTLFQSMEGQLPQSFSDCEAALLSLLPTEEVRKTA